MLRGRCEDGDGCKGITRSWITRRRERKEKNKDRQKNVRSGRNENQI